MFVQLQDRPYLVLCLHLVACFFIYGIPQVIPAAPPDKLRPISVNVTGVTYLELYICQGRRQEFCCRDETIQLLLSRNADR